MSRQEAVEEYAAALKRGRKYYKDCALHGRYPYPQVLDEVLEGRATAGQVDLGVIEIPMEQIIGTKTQGRRSPLLNLRLYIHRASGQSQAVMLQAYLQHLLSVHFYVHGKCFRETLIQSRYILFLYEVTAKQNEGH